MPLSQMRSSRPAPCPSTNTVIIPLATGTMYLFIWRADADGGDPLTVTISGGLNVRNTLIAAVARTVDSIAGQLLVSVQAWNAGINLQRILDGGLMAVPVGAVTVTGPLVDGSGILPASIALRDVAAISVYDGRLRRVNAAGRRVGRHSRPSHRHGRSSGRI